MRRDHGESVVVDPNDRSPVGVTGTPPSKNATTNNSTSTTKSLAAAAAVPSPKAGTNVTIRKPASSVVPNVVPNQNTSDTNVHPSQNGKAVSPPLIEIEAYDVASDEAINCRSTDKATKVAAAAESGDDKIPVQLAEKSSSNSNLKHQAAGCGTGETRKVGQTKVTRTHLHFSRKKRRFIWTSKEEQPSNKAPKLLDHRKKDGDSSAALGTTTTTTTAVNQSKWGKLRDKLFRFREQFPSLSVLPRGPNLAEDSDSSSEDERLLPMSEILVSPYEGNQSAEIGEEPLDEWKRLMKPLIGNDGDGDDDAMNPRLSNIYGDPLAWTIFRARMGIASLESLYETSWKWGKIGNQNLGWIPKRQLLLCLSENKISSPGKTVIPSPEGKQLRGCNTRDSDCDEKEDKNSNGGEVAVVVELVNEKREEERDEETESLQNVARKLECFELVIAAMQEWKLKYDYPELYSSKEGKEYVFKKRKKKKEDESDNDDDDDVDNDDNGNGDDEEASEAGTTAISIIKTPAMREWRHHCRIGDKYVGDKRKNDGDGDGKEASEAKTTEDIEKDAKKNCYKCLIFVARVFATLLLFNQEKEVKPSLLQKVRACLEILNKHAKAHPTELAKLLKKKKKRVDAAAKKESRKKKRIRLAGDYEEREATLKSSFALVQKESETLLKMMDYYKTRLMLSKDEHGDGDCDESNGDSYCHPHVSCLETMSEEIAATAKRDFAREERFRKKILLAREKRTKS